jgi:hypothetical protein
MVPVACSTAACGHSWCRVGFYFLFFILRRNKNKTLKNDSRLDAVVIASA